VGAVFDCYEIVFDFRFGEAGCHVN
jgi:hypothetical protein